MNNGMANLHASPDQGHISCFVDDIIIIKLNNDPQRVNTCIEWLSVERSIPTFGLISRCCIFSVQNQIAPPVKYLKKLDGIYP